MARNLLSILRMHSLKLIFKLLVLLFTSLCITSNALAFVYDEISPLPHISGPNCWNQALINSNLLKVHRYTSPKEFSYLVAKNCVQTNTPVEGSLGRITKDGKEYHAFTWLSETLVHAKNSVGALEIPRVMTFQEMFETYPVRPECINNSNSKASCETEIRYYNCNALKPNDVLEHDKFFDLELILNDIVYSQSTMKGPGFKRCDTTPVENRIQKLNQLSEQLQNLQAYGPFDSEYLEAWIDSINYQIEDIEASSKSSTCLLENDEQKKMVFPALYLQLKQLLN